MAASFGRKQSADQSAYICGSSESLFFFFLVSESRNSAHMLVALGLAFFNYSHGTHLFLFLYPFASETSTADEFPSLDCDFDTVKIKTSDNESGERD